MLGKAISALLILVGASAQAIDISTEDVEEAAQKITGMVELPISGMKAVESEGQILFLSENGRFVITGQIYDLWYKKPLSSMVEMEDVSQRIHIQQMGLNVNSLNLATLGQGEQEVVIFVDPLCKVCHRLMEIAQDFTEDYTFKFIAVPVLGDESNRLSKALSCINDPKKAFEALSSSNLKTYPTSCDSKRHNQTLLTAQLMNIKGVPFLIAPDGRTQRGLPKDLKKWLGDES